MDEEIVPTHPSMTLIKTHCFPGLICKEAEIAGHSDTKIVRRNVN